MGLSEVMNAMIKEMKHQNELLATQNLLVALQIKMQFDGGLNNLSRSTSLEKELDKIMGGTHGTNS